MFTEEKKLRYQSASTILSGLLAGHGPLSPGEESMLVQKAVDLAAELGVVNDEAQYEINQQKADRMRRSL